jgi:hypothetical protein
MHRTEPKDRRLEPKDLVTELQPHTAVPTWDSMSPGEKQTWLLDKALDCKRDPRRCRCARSRLAMSYQIVVKLGIRDAKGAAILLWPSGSLLRRLTQRKDTIRDNRQGKLGHAVLFVSLGLELALNG